MAVDPRSVGERIRDERLEAGLTVMELAELTGLSRTYLVRLENDKAANPSLDVLHRIAEALELTVADLLGLPAMRFIPDDADISTSLRAFADEAGLDTQQVHMLASIRWRKGEEPKTKERWRYIYNSLQASRYVDESGK
jgi:transcriptional regulator with XRE-family HTH domain